MIALEGPFLSAERGCYVIAEVGVNHNGSVRTAKKLIDSAAFAGADAVKFQTFFADDLVSRTAAKAQYQERNTDSAGNQHQMLSQLELTEAEFEELRDYCLTTGVDFLSTPFGFEAADLLERIGATAFKVSSGDLTYLQFLDYLARKGLPMIISTGMANLGEVETAVNTIDEAGPVPLCLLHCVSDYPTEASACNLLAIETMKLAFGRPVGWSDHTIGSTVAVAAVACGARIIEKHITLDRSSSGPDHAASIEPKEFASYVRDIRDTLAALGDGIKRPTSAELDTALVARRSVVAVRDLDAGAIVQEDDVALLRPGTGIPPHLFDLVLGTRLGRSVRAWSPLTVADLKQSAGAGGDP